MKDRRQSTRIDVSQSTTVEIDGKSHSVEIANISFGGTFVKSDLRPKVGSSVTLSDPRLGVVSGTIVRHTDNGFSVQLEKSDDSASYALKSITLDMIEKS